MSIFLGQTSLLAINKRKVSKEVFYFEMRLRPPSSTRNSASLSVLDQVTLQQLLKLFTFFPLMHTCIVMVCTALIACSRLHPAEVFIYERSAVCSVDQTLFA